MLFAVARCSGCSQQSVAGALSFVLHLIMMHVKGAGVFVCGKGGRGGARCKVVVLIS